MKFDVLAEKPSRLLNRLKRIAKNTGKRFHRVKRTEGGEEDDYYLIEIKHVESFQMGTDESAPGYLDGMLTLKDSGLDPIEIDARDRVRGIYFNW